MVGITRNEDEDSSAVLDREEDQEGAAFMMNERQLLLPFPEMNGDGESWKVVLQRTFGNNV